MNPEKYRPHTPHTIEGDRTPPRRPFLPLIPESDIRQKDTEMQKEIRTLIGSFNDQLLRELLAHHVQKAGGEKRFMNYIPLNRIQVLSEYNETYEPVAALCLDPETNRIMITVAPAEDMTERHMLLWAVIHEETHAVSELPAQVQQDEVGITLKGHGGVYETTVTKNASGEMVRSHHHSINEALTELQTATVYLEYVERCLYAEGAHGFSVEEALTAYRYAFNRIGGTREYSQYVRHATFLASFISAISEVDVRVVEEGMYRTYLRNGVVIPPELTQRLAEQVPDLQNALSFFTDAEEYDPIYGEQTALKDRLYTEVLSDEEKKRFDHNSRYFETKIERIKERIAELERMRMASDTTPTHS